jgi:quercetin dioxygenase-like cupin family protein
LNRIWFVVPALLAASLMFAACGGDDDDAAVPAIAQGVTQVERQLLAEHAPDTAPGQLLELTRVIVPPNEALPPHIHPGPQLAMIVHGTLTYTIIDGEATVVRAAGTANQTTETYGSGSTVELRTGDTVTEPPGMVHEAANRSGEYVIIYLSSLFEEGEPPATVVE